MDHCLPSHVWGRTDDWLLQNSCSVNLIFRNFSTVAVHCRGWGGGKTGRGEGSAGWFFTPTRVSVRWIFTPTGLPAGWIFYPNRSIKFSQKWLEEWLNLKISPKKSGSKWKSYTHYPGFYIKGCCPLLVKHVKSNLICLSGKLSWQPGCPVLNINLQWNFCISQGNGSGQPARKLSVDPEYVWF